MSSGEAQIATAAAEAGMERSGVGDGVDQFDSSREKEAAENAGPNSPDEDEDGTGPPGGRPAVETLREQNSRAQKRYRERQKLHKQKLKQELEELRSNSAKLYVAQQEKAHLELCAMELEKRLKAQQAEIVLLQQTVSASMSNASQAQPNAASEAGASSSCLQLVEAGVGQASEQGSVIEGAMLEVSQMRLRWVQQVHKMGLALATSHLDEKAMLSLIDEVCELFVELMMCVPSQAAAAAAGSGALAGAPPPDTGSLWGKCLLHTSLTSWGAFSSQKQAMHWKKVAMALKLQPLQCNQIMQLRSAALAELGKCFIARKALHSQLQLLESKQKLNMRTVRTTEAKLMLLQMSGQEGIMLLDKVKKNLLAERSVYLSLNNKCAQTVLLPSDMAKFMTECAPEQADVMMLASVYAGQDLTAQLKPQLQFYYQ